MVKIPATLIMFQVPTVSDKCRMGSVAGLQGGEVADYSLEKCRHK